LQKPFSFPPPFLEWLHRKFPVIFFEKAFVASHCLPAFNYHQQADSAREIFGPFSLEGFRHYTPAAKAKENVEEMEPNPERRHPSRR
jgi:hypothetical protein